METDALIRRRLRMTIRLGKNRAMMLALVVASLFVALALRVRRLEVDSRLGEIAAIEAPPPVTAVPPRELAPAVEPEALVDDPWLEAVVARLGRHFPSVLRDPAGHRLQILVTRIDGDRIDDRTVEHGYRVDAEYFYPASAIKPFLAVAALRHLEDLAAAEGDSIAIDTPLNLCLRGETSCTVARDPTNVAGGHVTVGHEIRKMLLVSSNVAYNRLFDFVGHELANRSLHGMGFRSVRLEHRIGGGISGGRGSPPYEIGDLRVERRTSDLPIEPLTLPGVRLGNAHYDDEGTLVEEPADFRFKNYASLRDHHRLLLAVAGVEPALPLLEHHRNFLVAAMEEDPLRSENPPYRGARFAESRFKVSLRGLRRVLPRAAFRHIGKGGRAYGFEIENAFVERRGRAFALTAVMYVNPNQVINDDGYAYDVSGGFLEALAAELAREILIR
jgi:hypothetical protein